MPRVMLRCLLVFAVCQLLFGPSESLAVEDWGPISVAGSTGSWALSAVYQPPAKEGCQNSDKKNACKEIDASKKGCYFPLGRRCKERDRKKPYAFEFELGSVEFDDTPTPGSQDDILYFSVGYRHYWLHCHKEDQVRFFAGVGLGGYDLEPDRELGFNIRVGGEVGLARKSDGYLYPVFELGVVYHKLDSGLDATDVLAGIRLYFPKGQ